LAWVGWQANLHTVYFWALAVAGGIMVKHGFWIRGRERQACFRAFLHNNVVGFVVFGGVFLGYGLR
jgi:4-hydroxybenzoate polyprenyltransferase